MAAEQIKELLKGPPPIERPEEVIECPEEGPEPDEKAPEMPPPSPDAQASEILSAIVNFQDD